MDNPETWQWVWLAAAFAFAVGEMGTAGSFFLLPFAIGSAVALVLALTDVGLNWQWAAFVSVSVVTFAALRPLARRLDRDTPHAPGIGAGRWTGRRGVVLEDIPGGPNDTGMVRVDRETWRAESADGTPIATGTTIKVVRVEGTRVVVERDDHRQGTREEETI